MSKMKERQDQRGRPYPGRRLSRLSETETFQVSWDSPSAGLCLDLLVLEKVKARKKPSWSLDLCYCSSPGPLILESTRCKPFLILAS